MSPISEYPIPNFSVPCTLLHQTNLNPTHPPMKIQKTLLALVIGSALAVGAAFAADAKKDAAPKTAACCAKAAKDGKACGHECCVKAAKDSKNCEKCGGAGAIEAKK